MQGRADVSTCSSVVLVSDGKQLRSELVRYLTDASFEVRPTSFPPTGPQDGVSLVWLPDREVAPSVIATVVDAWLTPRRAAHAAPDPRRVVLVTSQPTAFRLLLETHGTHVIVLVPPVFGWQLVDALRSPEGSGQW
jgi:hypothetical protein